MYTWYIDWPDPWLPDMVSGGQAGESSLCQDDLLIILAHGYFLDYSSIVMNMVLL